MTLWRVVAVTARALPFRRMYSNAFTHGRVHTDCGVCVAQDNDFELVLRSPHPLRAGQTLNRVPGVRGWAG